MNAELVGVSPCVSVFSLQRGSAEDARTGRKRRSCEKTRSYIASSAVDSEVECNAKSVNIRAIRSTTLWTSASTSRVYKRSSGRSSGFGGRTSSNIRISTSARSASTPDSWPVGLDRLKRPHRCKKLVNAEKTFAIDEAPMALTIHLKRFEANGRKITDLVKYPALLNLGPAMCDQREVRLSRRFSSVNQR